MIDEFYKSSDLLEKGWTRPLIKKLLPSPDKEVKNRMSYGVTYLYSKKRVEDIERSDSFIEIKQAAQTRSSKAQKVADQTKTKNLNTVKKISITVARLEVEKVIDFAIESYNDHHYFDSTNYATKDSDQSFLDRIAVNFIRHELTFYDNMLHEQFRKVGKVEAIAIIQEKVFDEIAKIYPEFANEAKRQKIRKLSGWRDGY